MADEQTPAAPATPAAAPLTSKHVVLLKEIERDGDPVLAGKLLKLTAAEADQLIAAHSARLASATDIAVGSV